MTTVPTTTAPTTPPTTAATPAADDGGGKYDGLLFVVEALVVIGAIVMGTRSSGVGLGIWGGVGTAVIPLLARANARVVATATEDDAATLRALGAAETIGYAESGYPSDVDVALNLTLPSDALAGVARAVRGGGRLLTITYPVPEQSWIDRPDVTLAFVLDMDGAFGGMREVGELATAGHLPATIGRRYTGLAAGVDACVAFLREHTTGKLVVTVP